MKKIVQRTCVACNSKKDKKELIRIVLNKEGKIFVDEKGKAEGRGMYICSDEECLEKLKKNKKIEKTFGISINDELCNYIRGVIIEKRNQEQNS